MTRHRRRRTLAGALAMGTLLAGISLNNPAQAAANSCVPDTFGRMFQLPAASWDDSALQDLSERVMADPEANPAPEDELDGEDNTAIEAGYTYVGQLIDHDITLTGTEDLGSQQDPYDQKNFRTPSLDLDSLYGDGPSGSPELYQSDGVHLKVGRRLGGSSTDWNARDLPRDDDGHALLGDGRDDENRLVGGLHSILIRFHNKRADTMRFWHPFWSNARVLAATRDEVRKYYQYAVLTDYLPKVAGQSTVNTVLPSLQRAARNGVHLGFYNPCADGMPVEFSVGAYRFGHSQVRALYRINTSQSARVPVFTPDYTDASANLSGFTPAPGNYGIDWSYFFPIGVRRVNRPQYSYKIDNSLTNSLTQLPLPSIGGQGPTTLATRNLLRSKQFGLPSGQDVAREMGVTPLRDDQIVIGKAEPGATMAITDVDETFAGKAPLWTYLLAESVNEAYPVSGGEIVGEQHAPYRLGPVGARIVTETLVGLVWADQSSVLHDPGFTPDWSVSSNGRFGFTELIKYTTR